jgi:hypothetical protein
MCESYPLIQMKGSRFANPIKIDKDEIHVSNNKAFFRILIFSIGLITDIMLAIHLFSSQFHLL